MTSDSSQEQVNITLEHSIRTNIFMMTIQSLFEIILTNKIYLLELLSVYRDLE